jgi:hypothetical protein
MSTEKLDALIVRNLSDLDAAARRLRYDIQARVGKAIDEIAEAWTKKHSWDGVFGFDKDTLKVAPRQWKVSNNQGDEEWLGWFELEAGLGDDWDSDDATDSLDFFWLTRLCGAGRGIVGFRWHCGTEALGTTRPKWKKFIQGQIQRINKKTDFSYEDTGNFFRPIQVETEKLAAAVEGDAIDMALQPIRDALDRLLIAEAEFDAILKSAKKEFSA